MRADPAPPALSPPRLRRRAAARIARMGSARVADPQVLRES
jgi:hypothetical protein